MHYFWFGSGLVFLIIGLGALTIVGGLAGIPTLISLLQLMLTPGSTAASSPLNLLQGLQIVLTVLGIFALLAGFA